MNKQINRIMKKDSCRGQNVIEYLLLTVAVVIVLFFVVNPKQGPMKKALENILNDTVVDISGLSSELRYGAVSINNAVNAAN